MRNRRTGGEVEIHGLALEAFSRHEIVRLDDRSVACARPGSEMYGFEVVALGWNSVIVHGDLDAVVFQGGGDGPLVERVAWVARNDPSYLRAKAQRASGGSLWEFDREAFADAVGEAVAHLRESQGELNAEERERLEAADDLAGRLRECDEIGEESAWREAHELDLGLEHPQGYVYSPRLLWATEAARCAFRLPNPDDAVARFLEAPSAQALHMYNCVVEANRRASAKHLAAARRSVVHWERLLDDLARAR